MGNFYFLILDLPPPSPLKNEPVRASPICLYTYGNTPLLCPHISVTAADSFQGKDASEFNTKSVPERCELPLGTRVDSQNF